MSDDRRAEMTLPGTPDSVGAARRFLRQTLDDWQLDALVDSAALLVSELATNAVLHARSSYSLVVEEGPESVRVSLLDGSSRQPVRRTASLQASTGRGLGLVATMATSWGALDPPVPPPWRKGVWFELPCDPPPEPAEGALYGEAWLSAVDDL